MQVLPHENFVEVFGFESSVSPKGQITLPLSIRKKLGIKPKDKVSILLKGHNIHVQKSQRSLAQSYMAVPALKKKVSWEDVRKIAREDSLTNN